MSRLSSPEKAARAVDGDQGLLAPVARYDSYLPVQDHDEVVSFVAFPKQHLAWLRAPPLATPGESLDLRLA